MFPLNKTKTLIAGSFLLGSLTLPFSSYASKHSNNIPFQTNQKYQFELESDSRTISLECAINSVAQPVTVNIVTSPSENVHGKSSPLTLKLTSADVGKTFYWEVGAGARQRGYITMKPATPDQDNETKAVISCWPTGIAEREHLEILPAS